MFSIDLKKEQEKKEQLRQEKVDKMLQEYDNENDKNNKKLGEKKAESGFLGGSWVKNDHANRFLKCMSPAFATIGVGCAFWAAGFVVNEATKIASFLNGIALPEDFTGLISTPAFWKFVGLVAAICAVVFIITTIISVAKSRSLRKLKSQSKGKNIEKQKNIEKSIESKKTNEIDGKAESRAYTKEVINNNDKYDLFNSKEIRHNENINKGSYNSMFAISKQYKDDGYKNLNSNLDIDIKNRNSQVVSGKNDNKFTAEDKEVVKNADKNKKDYYNENIKDLNKSE